MVDKEFMNSLASAEDRLDRDERFVREITLLETLANYATGKSERTPDRKDKNEVREELKNRVESLGGGYEVMNQELRRLETLKGKLPEHNDFDLRVARNDKWNNDFRKSYNKLMP